MIGLTEWSQINYELLRLEVGLPESCTVENIEINGKPKQKGRFVLYSIKSKPIYAFNSLRLNWTLNISLN